MNRRVRLGCILGALVAGCCAPLAGAGISAPIVASVADPDLDATIKSVFDLNRYSLQKMDVPAASDRPASVRVTLGDRQVTLALMPYTMRADDFTVLLQQPDGSFQRIEPAPPCIMRGDIPNDPGSEVRAALIRGGLEATIRLGDGSTWAIQPVAHSVPGVDQATHVVYSERDVAPPPGFRCGTPDPVNTGNLLRPSGGTPQPRTTGDRITDIAFDADVEYFVANGSNAKNVINDIESIMNAVEGIYEFNTDISYEETVIVVRTSEPDPYSSTSPNTLLGQFQSSWNANNAAVRRDVAQLFTGKDIASASGGVIGISFLGTICSTANAYSLVQSRYTTNITLRRSLSAHEIGHSWNAQHCNNSGDCNIMCSCNGCGPAQGCTGIFTSFGNTEVGQIVAFRNTRGCLLTEPAPFTPPFFDDFPNASIDTAKWVYIFGAGISSGSVNPPSSPRAVQLNAAGAGTFQDDDLRSTFIPLVGVTNPQLTYYVEARGVPNGKQLFVDVWTSNLRWVTVNTITSDGADDTAFTLYSHALSGVSGAVHNEFRVRFRVDVDSTSQNWYVDNVYVGVPQGPATGACCLSNGTCTVLTQSNCLAQGGVYQGDGMTCGAGTCPQPPGACCLSAGGCTTVANEVLCIALGGVFQGSGSTCGTANCPEPPGGCCFPNGTCVDVANEAACTAQGGVFQGNGTPCETANCPAPTGACCLASGQCTQVDAATCATQGGTYNGNGSTCGQANCTQPAGACCLASGACTTAADAAACSAQGGTFQGAGSSCGAISCPQPPGACCLSTGQCIQTDATGCAAQGGTFNGTGSACGKNTCPHPCPCDWNNSGSLNSQDFFDFLTAFFNANADYNHDGQTNSQDYFDFLGCFFSGC